MAEEALFQPGAPDPRSREYREKLLRKLEGLIVILEVALARIQTEMRAPRADGERLHRVSENLNRTLRVCRRARAGLERGEAVPGLISGEIAMKPEEPNDSGRLSDSASPDPRPMTFRDYVELSSLEEFRRFRRLPPVRMEDVRSVNLESLLQRLLGA
ncbi:MAG TPA: hypothetical protein VFI25_14530 [Planctomycetota bacterium]|jgi:hypothetical protein|nr:hypothetical protein [Planctomycetota bacterium]